MGALALALRLDSKRVQVASVRAGSVILTCRVSLPPYSSSSSSSSSSGDSEATSSAKTVKGRVEGSVEDRVREALAAAVFPPHLGACACVSFASELDLTQAHLLVRLVLSLLRALY